MLGNFDHRVLLCFIAVANVVHVQTGMRILHEQLTDLTGTSPLRGWDSHENYQKILGGLGSS